jgi:hypothetical protein
MCVRRSCTTGGGGVRHLEEYTPYRRTWVWYGHAQTSKRALTGNGPRVSQSVHVLHVPSSSRGRTIRQLLYHILPPPNSATALRSRMMVMGGSRQETIITHWCESAKCDRCPPFNLVLYGASRGGGRGGAGESGDVG